MPIVGRVKELKIIKKNMDVTQKEMVVLYGRRRLGKTTILREACADRKHLFFSCPQASASESLRLFQARLGECFSDPVLQQVEFKSWHDAISFSFTQCSKHKVPIVFDEFPYLMRSVPGIDSTIQHAWDHHQDTIWLTLCGSVLSVMENEVLGHAAPLYGRRTEQLELTPMTFSTVSEFYSQWSFAEKVYAYSFFGGMPAYAQRAAQYQNPIEAILELVFDPNGYLYQEPEFLLREELREPNLYFSLLHALAIGCTRSNEIAQKAGISPNSVGKYIDTLRKMRLVEKKVPITEKHPERSSKGIYRISDPFLSFWFRFVFPNRSAIDLNKGEYVWRKLEEDYLSYIGFVYEKIALEMIVERGEKILHWVPAKVGSYWERDLEIDIVAEALSEKRVAFFECKWSNEVNIDKQLANLRRKAATINAYRDYEHEYFIISRTRTKAYGHIFFG